MTLIDITTTTNNKKTTASHLLKAWSCMVLEGREAKDLMMASQLAWVAAILSSTLWYFDSL